MPRRLLILWLIFSILGYGVAMAADLHLGSTADASHLVDLSPDSPDPSNDAPGCDHCCHGMTHLLGLVRLESGLSALTGISFGAHKPPVYRPFAPPALDRPPSLG